MEEYRGQIPEQILQTMPGGIAKLALDDILTILYATDTFYSMIRNVTDKTVLKGPSALLRMVYSADIIYVTQQLATQKHRKDNSFSLNFRTLQQDGSIKWVMITGNKTEETYQSGSKNVPVYTCFAVDITSLMISYKKLEQMNDYHRIISELSKDLFFEYEIAADTLTFSEIFHEVFGKDSLISGFRKRLEKAKMIHPDELPAVISIFNSMMNGRKQARFEITLFSKDGNPNLYTCYASIIFDENKNPSKVVGKLSASSSASKETEKQKYKPVLDSATQVCTKESAEIMIRQALTECEADSLSALLVIDIRNYKNLNEIRRSANGENILTAIGRILKGQLRTSDIIGRLSLGEFVIFMKDLHSEKTVFEIADQTCKEIDAIFSYEHAKNGLSASIGIALVKGTQDYQTLYANANTALVMAKKIPTSSFEMFYGTIG